LAAGFTHRDSGMFFSGNRLRCSLMASSARASFVVATRFFNLKNSVGGRKSRSCFDRLSTNGMFSDHPTGELPFALSSPRSGRVEGLSCHQQRFPGLTISPHHLRAWDFVFDPTTGRQTVIAVSGTPDDQSHDRAPPLPDAFRLARRNRSLGAEQAPRIPDLAPTGKNVRFAPANHRSGCL